MELTDAFNVIARACIEGRLDRRGLKTEFAMGMRAQPKAVCKAFNITRTAGYRLINNHKVNPGLRASEKDTGLKEALYTLCIAGAAGTLTWEFVDETFFKGVVNLANERQNAESALGLSHTHFYRKMRQWMPEAIR